MNDSEVAKLLEALGYLPSAENMNRVLSSEHFMQGVPCNDNGSTVDDILAQCEL